MWVFDQSEHAHGPVCIIMENTPLVKFIRNYNQNMRDVFSTSSLVRILMTSFPAFSLLFGQTVRKNDLSLLLKDTG